MAHEEEFECEDCEDTGELFYDETDSTGQTVGIGTISRPCHCQDHSDDDGDWQHDCARDNE